MPNIYKTGRFAHLRMAGFPISSVPFWLASVCLIQVCTVQPVLGQKTGGSSSTGGGATSGSVAGTRTTGNGNGTYGNNGTFSNSSGNTLGNRPVFLSGRVIFDDGSRPNSEIRIERICRSGSPRLEAHTDSKGQFSFQFGQNEPLDLDAADAANGSYSGRSGGQQTLSSGSGSSSSALLACELRASYPGYRSDILDLSTRRSLDDPDLGTIVLHRLGNVQGTTISLTSALAPKHAKKEYEKGIQQAQKGKDEEAEKDLSAATQDYPKYAEAWFALGELQAKNGHPDEAQKSFQAAVTADPKYVSPYDQMALLAAKTGKWQQAADYSRQAIQLNPVEFPTAFWYNALANYNLSKPADAEKSAKELLKVDTQHHFPEIEYLYAQMLLDKGDYPGAAAHLRTYVTLVPTGKNTESAKKALAKLDEANAQSKKQ